MIVKKYANRRLYDTEGSCYITLEELAEKIKKGAEVRVVDARTNEDLTQVTLTQIIIESRGAARLLPVPLLTQLIRMGDDALAEFLGRYMSTALELYLQAKQGAQALAPYNPLANVPFAVTNALARLIVGGLGLGGPQSPPPGPAYAQWPEPAPPAPPPSPPPPAPANNDVADLRRELEALKASLKDGKRRR
ncbi:MAG: polyhydroxyalkanoate synthesis regulator DNA-binding domain-containing protein [Byssovorax sp.]